MFELKDFYLFWLILGGSSTTKREREERFGLRSILKIGEPPTHPCPHIVENVFSLRENSLSHFLNLAFLMNISTIHGRVAGILILFFKERERGRHQPPYAQVWCVPIALSPFLPHARRGGSVTLFFVRRSSSSSLSLSVCVCVCVCVSYEQERDPFTDLRRLQQF